MASFVLVHGAWLGGWCWDEVAAPLRQAGHAVLAPDLHGHGDDPTPIQSMTLAGYVDAIAGAVRAQPGPVVLVGHSMAGAVISEVAERIPDAVETLVYVAAHLLRDGESVLAVARTDAETRLRPHLRYDEAAGTLSVAPEGFASALLSGCSAEDSARAREKTRPAAIAPLATPVRLTEARFGSVRRAYVETTRDAAVSPALQRRMLEATPCAVLRIDTGHAPFFQAPAQLARVLVEAARAPHA